MRFHDGPHGGIYIMVPVIAIGACTYTFPDCGCRYFGYGIADTLHFWYQGKATQDEPVPEAFTRAFA